MRRVYVNVTGGGAASEMAATDFEVIENGVVVITDSGDSRGEPRTEEHNRFLDDFLRRGGSADGVVVKGTCAGHITDIASNPIQNTGGIYDASIKAPCWKSGSRRLPSVWPTMTAGWRAPTRSSTRATRRSRSSR